MPLVSASLLKTLQKVTRVHVPHAYTLVQTTSSQETIVWGDGDCRDTILDCKAQNALVLVDIPKTYCAVARSRSNVATVRRVVERVDVLFVASEVMADNAISNVPNSDDLILGTSSQVVAIWTEADTSNVKVAICW